MTADAGVQSQNALLRPSSAAGRKTIRPTSAASSSVWPLGGDRVATDGANGFGNLERPRSAASVDPCLPPHRARVAAVMQTRRRMQDERKAQLALIRPTHDATRFNADGPFRSKGCPVTVTGPSTAIEGVFSAPPANGSREASVEKSQAWGEEDPAHVKSRGGVKIVDRFHREMVRREVMSQKLRFLDRQVVESLDAQEREQRLAATINEASCAEPRVKRGSRCTDTLKSQGRNLDGVTSRRASTDTLKPQGRHLDSVTTKRGTDSSCSSCCTVSLVESPNVPSGADFGSNTSRTILLSDTWQQKSGPLRRYKTYTQKGGDGGGRRLSSEGCDAQSRTRSKCFGRLPPRRTAAASRRGSNHVRAAHHGRPVEPTARILGTCASEPTLASVQFVSPQEVEDIRESYYENDEKLMLEDLLHASNPQLFPLQPGRGRQLQVENLLPLGMPNAGNLETLLIGH